MYSNCLKYTIMIILATFSIMQLISVSVGICILIGIGIAIVYGKKIIVCGKIIKIEPPEGNNIFTNIVLLTNEGSQTCRVYTSILPKIRVGEYIGLQKRGFEHIYNLDYLQGIHWNPSNIDTR